MSMFILSSPRVRCPAQYIHPSLTRYSPVDTDGPVIQHVLKVNKQYGYLKTHMIGSGTVTSQFMNAS